MFNYCSK